IYTLSLHDALPIFDAAGDAGVGASHHGHARLDAAQPAVVHGLVQLRALLEPAFVADVHVEVRVAFRLLVQLGIAAGPGVLVADAAGERPVAALQALGF